MQKLFETIFNNWEFFQNLIHILYIFLTNLIYLFYRKKLWKNVLKIFKNAQIILHTIQNNCEFFQNF